MSFAIIETGGKQFRVAEGDVVKVPSLSVEEGQEIEFAVVAREADGKAEVGTPILEGAHVTATVLEHGRDAKVVVFKKKRRKQYKRKQGHRQGFTEVRIESLG